MKSLRTSTKLSLSNTTRVNPVAEFGLFELCSEGEDKPGTQGKEALEHEAIKTTVPKAKELRRVVEPMITLAKVDTVANRRLAFNRLRNRAIVTKLFEVLGPRFANRNGGYTRILKMGYRVGDNAPMAYMELTERAEAVEEVKEEKAAE